MVQIATLDKKLYNLKMRFTLEDMKLIIATHTLTEEKFKENVQQQLYINFIKGVAHNIPTVVESNPKDITFTVSGYVLSERQMYDLLREMCEMDEQGKKMIMAEIDRILYPVYHEEKPTDTTTPVAHIKLDENPTD